MRNIIIGLSTVLAIYAGDDQSIQVFSRPVSPSVDPFSRSNSLIKDEPSHGRPIPPEMAQKDNLPGSVDEFKDKEEKSEHSTYLRESIVPAIPATQEATNKSCCVIL